MNDDFKKSDSLKIRVIVTALIMGLLFVFVISFIIVNCKSTEVTMYRAANFISDIKENLSENGYEYEIYNMTNYSSNSTDYYDYSFLINSSIDLSVSFRNRLFVESFTITYTVFDADENSQNQIDISLFCTIQNIVGKKEYSKEYVNDFLASVNKDEIKKELDKKSKNGTGKCIYEKDKRFDILNFNWFNYAVYDDNISIFRYHGFTK